MGSNLLERKLLKGMTVVALSSSLILSSLGNVGHASKAVGDSKVEDILANLTPTQIAALNELTTNESKGLQISSNIDLNSNVQTNVIVEFANKPVKIARVEASVDGKNLAEAEATKLVEKDHEDFQADVSKVLVDEKRSKVHFKINRSYKHAFNGVAMSLPANQIKNLLKSKAVKTIWNNEKFSIDPPKQTEK
ncbi:protease inhibitor I9 family protein [Bacillus sp. AFS041924]|uniref:protease inhibitor I9 family protein n=1 Tax=Bacillus sp. AFS041924 TaxID=2033503 RepID=UPI0020D2731E|nr:protease inhibitor I9 family protein [Bacillus sp. AFS041924]